MLRVNMYILDFGSNVNNIINRRKYDHLTRYLIILFLIINLKSFSIESKSIKSLAGYHHSHQSYVPQQQQRLFLISLGGFRHDFIQNYNLVNFLKFIQDGSRASYLNPQFPTQTFPNHWSIATGTYVETHGVIAKMFYDPVYKEYFNQNKLDKKWCNETEPIWFSALRQGIKTGVFYWPACESIFINTSLHSRTNYNDNVPLNFKINQSLKLFLNEDYQFVSIYHNQPDAIAHKYGINSPEFNVTLNQIDESFGHLIEQLKSSGLYNSNNFNMIIVSDHGMANIKRNIIINDFFNEDDASIWSFSRNLIHLKPIIDLDLLLMKLSKIPDITVTLKENMPERLHYRENRRIADVIISAYEGVGFIYLGKEPIQITHNGRYLTNEQKKLLLIAAADKATHGYDKIYPNMRGIFLARGAMFKRNYSSDIPIENIDIYPLICNILYINCEQRNGSFDRVKRFLKHEHRALFQIDRLEFIENSSSIFSNLNVFFYIIILFIVNYLKH